MQKIEVFALSISDLQRMLDLAAEKAIKAYQESQKQPSKYEEITLTKAAEELHCSKATIRRKMKAMNIKPLRIGREMLIKRFMLERIKGG